MAQAGGADAQIRQPGCSADPTALPHGQISVQASSQLQLTVQSTHTRTRRRSAPAVPGAGRGRAPPRAPGRLCTPLLAPRLLHPPGSAVPWRLGKEGGHSRRESSGSTASPPGSSRGAGGPPPQAGGRDATVPATPAGAHPSCRSTTRTQDALQQLHGFGAGRDQLALSPRALQEAWHVLWTRERRQKSVRFRFASPAEFRALRAACAALATS